MHCVKATALFFYALYNKKTSAMTSRCPKKLGYSDSNQEKQDQNLLCYHYTIAQNHLSIPDSGFDGAKVQLFHNIASV